MKNIRKTQSILKYGILLVFIVFGYTSCKKNSSGDGGAAPVITRIRTVSKTDTITVTKQITLDSSSTTTNPNNVIAFDSTTTSGSLSNQYGIVGKNLKTTTKIYVNGVQIYFNPNFVTDTFIIFTLPTTVPYSSSSTSNKVTVVTLNGSVDFTFLIKQPAATISSVSQLAGAAGDQVTITGTVLNGLSGVKFGTTSATIVSSTATSAVVTVPAGLTGANVISVTTTASLGGGTATGPTVSGGATASGTALTSVAPFGFNTLIYDDAFSNGWSDYGWSNTPDNSSNTQVKRGTNSIQVSYAGGFDGFVLQTSSAVAAQYIKLSVYGATGTNGKLIHVLVNDDFSKYVTLTLVEGAWTTYNIPVSAFAAAGGTAPTTITDIIFQEFSGNASVFYLDDVGII
jgi:hypothetical protein